MHSAEQRTPLDHAILAGSWACCLVAAWLFGVVVLVLPTRAPASIGAWIVVAVSLVILALAGAAQGALILASALLRGRRG